jgi:collagenase-like PrtC family protease
MIEYNLGCNFDERLLDGVDALNRESSVCRITDFYGAAREHAWLSARPAYRIPDIALPQIRRFIADAHDAGVRFNYLLNTIYPGTKRDLSRRAGEIRDIVRWLIDSGVNCITVATPLIAGLVREVSPTVELEVSTIAHVDTITQIKIWHDHYGVTRVCGNLLKNRSVTCLRRAADYCTRNGIRYELLANEFCGVGTIGPGHSTTHCIYRDSCYLCHAGNETREDDALMDRYPMARCMESRKGARAWLKTHFIRPEDLRQYATLGISRFKLTGRTGTTPFILVVAEAYMKQRWDGNLLALWKPLQTVATGASEQECELPAYIDNRQLDGFVDWWFMHPEQECANEICGETCRHCDDYAEMMHL